MATKKKIRRIRRMKYHLFRMRIHRFLPRKKLLFLAQLSAISKWIDEHRHIPFTEFPCKSFDYSRRYTLYQHLLENELQDEPFDYLEFGVAKGISFKWWAAHALHPASRFLGFDTFSGLPEDWGPFKKGDMSGDNEPPEMDDARCSFYSGIFQQTLPVFLKGYSGERRKVVHLDADLYTSTLFVLTSLSPVLHEGDILLFDEFNVPMHEFRAFSEWARSYYIHYEVIGETNNFFQVAMRLK